LAGADIDPHTQLLLEVWKLIVTAGVSLIVGGITVAIQMRQTRTASEQRRIAAAKLNLDLFEERYELFYKVWGFLSDALEDTADRFTTQLHPEFTNLLPKARFLFGEEIGKYMEEANKMRNGLSTVLKIQQRSGGVPQFEGRNIGEYQLWFADEATNCFKRFGPYLDFSQWKA
jgi:hypothetical protein